MGQPKEPSSERWEYEKCVMAARLMAQPVGLTRNDGAAHLAQGQELQVG